jgi:hypothetical protein
MIVSDKQADDAVPLINLAYAVLVPSPDDTVSVVVEVGSDIGEPDVVVQPTLE